VSKKKLTLGALDRRLSSLVGTVGGHRKSIRSIREQVADLIVSVQGLAGDVRNLFGNDMTLKHANDGLADRYYGLVDLLRSRPDLEELLTDERIVVAANKRRTARVEKEQADAAAQEVQDVENRAKENSEPVQDGGVPQGATVFGGGS